MYFCFFAELMASHSSKFNQLNVLSIKAAEPSELFYEALWLFRLWPKMNVSCLFLRSDMDPDKDKLGR